MRITVNGENHELSDRARAAELITALGLEGQRIALEVNGEIVPRSARDAHSLHDGDRIEIVHAIGGG